MPLIQKMKGTQQSKITTVSPEKNFKEDSNKLPLNT